MIRALGFLGGSGLGADVGEVSGLETSGFEVLASVGFVSSGGTNCSLAI